MHAKIKRWDLQDIDDKITHMIQKRKPLDRYYSDHPLDAEWRRAQAHVDADIEGLSRDPVASQMAEDMIAEGIGVEERIRRLKTYFIGRQRELDMSREP